MTEDIISMGLIILFVAYELAVNSGKDFFCHLGHNMVSAMIPLIPMYIIMVSLMIENIISSPA